MCCSNPSCTEDDPRAQKKPTKGNPKFVKTTQGLESKGLKGKKTINLKTTGVVQSHPQVKIQDLKGSNT